MRSAMKGLNLAPARSEEWLERHECCHGTGRSMGVHYKLSRVRRAAPVASQNARCSSGPFPTSLRPTSSLFSYLSDAHSSLLPELVSRRRFLVFSLLPLIAFALARSPRRRCAESPHVLPIIPACRPFCLTRLSPRVPRSRNSTSAPPLAQARGYPKAYGTQARCRALFKVRVFRTPRSVSCTACVLCKLRQARVLHCGMFARLTPC